MNTKKKVVVVGAGPGGLACGMLLAKNGFDVHMYEKREIVGGRNGFLQAGDFKFDIGPTFFLMKDVLEKIFQLCGRQLDDYVQTVELDPMYRLAFRDKTFIPSTNQETMLAELERVFPGNADAYRKYMISEKKKYDRLMPCLEVPYGRIRDYLSMNLVRAIPHLDAHISVYDVLKRYFDDHTLRICFTFQAKYIGMSPWDAPGLFSMISYIEHGGGVYHITGGLNNLSQAMGRVVEEEGGTIHCSSPVREVIVENSTASGIVLEDGGEVRADYVILNADFAHAMKHLVPGSERKKYTDERLDRMKYSCSTFMLYLGLDKVYENLNHHNIFFSDDYKRNVEEISGNAVIPDDPSFYLQNPSITDSSMAPAGKSSVYVLVPIGNTSGGIDWKANTEAFKEKMLSLLESKAGMKELKSHIEELRVITPDDWRDNMDVYHGATFNLRHNLGQMLYFRPHNEFEDVKNCYLVGGGTHPGSGLPTIYESGRISAAMILEREGIALEE